MTDGLTISALSKRCRSFRPSRLDDPETAAKYALRSLASRYRQLSDEVRDLEAEIERLTRSIASALVNTFGVGPCGMRCGKIAPIQALSYWNANPSVGSSSRKE